MEKNNIIIYTSPDNQTEVSVTMQDETVWLTQAQMAEVFDRDVRTINDHLENIFSDWELYKDSTIRKFRIVRKEGQREVSREIEHYNLDAIISVGYRVNSKRGTAFRIWATTRLREYLVQWYTINQKRLDEFMVISVLKIMKYLILQRENISQLIILYVSKKFRWLESR